MTSVDLWVHAVAHIPPDTAVVDVLSAVELARRDELRRDDDRRRFVGGALLVRTVAGAAIGCPPQQVPVRRHCRWCAGPHGPPTVEGAPSMSLSHAGDVVLLATCVDAWVGVDVEPAGRDVPSGIDDLVLSPQERESAWSEGDLLRYWVRKEAVLKALGLGLTVPMTELTVSLPTEPAALLAHRLDTTEPIALADVDLPGRLVSVAVAGPAAATTPVVTVRDAPDLLAALRS